MVDELGEKRAVVERELCNAIKAFQESPDEEKRISYSKEFFWSYCERNELDPRVAFAIVEDVLTATSKIYNHLDYSDVLKALKEDINQKEPDIDERE